MQQPLGEMSGVFQSPSSLSSCILAGVGAVLLALVFDLAPLYVSAPVGGSAAALCLVLARLRGEGSTAGRAGAGPRR